MKRLWPVLFLLLPAAAILPFLPLRRIAWKLTSEDDAYSPWLIWLMERQRADGSWNEGPATLEGHPLGPPGMTGLALEIFLGQGYSHLSKDTYEWHDVGPCVKRALQWLMADQLPDGNFRSGAGTLDHALATFALSEAYGYTGSNLFKDQAQAAVDALVARILAGELGQDAALHARAAVALKSAEISGLSFRREAYERLRSFYDARGDRTADAGEIVTRILLDKNKADPRLPPGIAELSRRTMRGEEQDFSGWYWTTLALFQYDGPRGASWKAWDAQIRGSLVDSHSSRGDWPGRQRGETFVRTCLAATTLLIHYRYANVFGGR